MLSVSSNRFNRYLDIEKEVNSDVIKEDSVRYFDNDGFELSFLEQEYYSKNKVQVANILNHVCNQQEWFICNHSKFKLDHSMILQRWSFVKDAREQLEIKKDKFPQLNKYLKLKPKWGVDFALEYYDGDTALEVLHVEQDYRNFYEAIASKQILEDKLLSTDWIDFVEKILKRKSEWEGLNGMDQNDWKASFWGLPKAEKTLKAFA